MHFCGACVYYFLQRHAVWGDNFRRKKRSAYAENMHSRAGFPCAVGKKKSKKNICGHINDAMTIYTHQTAQAL
ncbi:hypothetical protein EB241_11255 [Erwinia psidii]|uniref:Uncharacterized protein n=1 Tax=Erwinia psidii TaxID=69224 RepID=A0A3N6S0K5_9GAMM|nr:hypothetical protein EB241_11255 [Erwinia psidii]